MTEENPEKRRPSITDPHIQAQVQKRLRKMPMEAILAARRRPKPEQASAHEDEKTA